MKKLTITIASLFMMLISFSQTVFLRHDTAVLNASECNWLVPSVKQSSVSKANEITVAQWLLSAIKKGKLKAVDALTGKTIAADKITAWKMPADTVAVYDSSRNVQGYKLVQTEVNPERISRLRILQDWYMNYNTSMIVTKLLAVELLIEVYSESGLYIGYKPFCTINLSAN